MCLSLRSYTNTNSYPVSNINKHNAAIFSCYESFVLFQTVNIIIYVCSHSNETKRNYNNKYIINIIIYVCSHSNKTKRNYNNKYIINIIHCTRIYLFVYITVYVFMHNNITMCFFVSNVTLSSTMLFLC